MATRTVGDPGRAAVSRRSLFRAAVKIGLLTGAAAFAGIFAHGLLAPGGGASGDFIDPAGVPPGAARLDAWNGKPVWVVHRSAGQMASLAQLSGHVLEPDMNQPPAVDNLHRSRVPEFGVYLAETARAGILVQFVDRRPRRLDEGLPWHGGFIDPGGDALFDVAGRRYRATPGGPLAVPPHHVDENGIIRLGRW